MNSILIEIPDSTLVALKVDATRGAAEVRIAAAMKLYELGRLSSDAAAELAGLPRVTFLTRLSEYGVDTFRQTEDDIASDLARA